MSIEDMVKLIEAATSHGLTSFEYETETERITIKKKKKKVSQLAGPAGVAAMVPEPAASSAAEKQVPVLDIGSDKVVSSPLVGTFYSASSPESEPFVKVGDTVKKGQILGIIEAMKLMNEIESDYDGVVEAVLVKNEEVVEYGQPLFRIH